jgi:hypothetical protein
VSSTPQRASTCPLWRSERLLSAIYKRDGDASGANCGPLSAAEQKEIDGLSCEEMRAKWGRPSQAAFAKGASSYRGVSKRVASPQP